MSPIDVYIADANVRPHYPRVAGREGPVSFHHSPLPVSGAALVIVVREPFSIAAVRSLQPLLEQLSSGVESEILRAARSVVPGELMHVVAKMVATAPLNPSVDRLAASAGMCRRTLAARLKAANLPPAGVLIAWVRTLLAAHALGNCNATPASVASALSFGSVRSLRRQLSAHGAAVPSRLRRSPAAFLTLLEAFIAAVGNGASRPPVADRRVASSGSRSW
ncbi:MAG: hypothetical protein ACYC2G_12195 [Gemmatimonadaceae bacterium]